MNETSAGAAFLRACGISYVQPAGFPRAFGIGGPKPSVKASTVTPVRTAREANSAKQAASVAKPKAGASGRASPTPAARVAAPRVVPVKVMNFDHLVPAEPDEATTMAAQIVAAGKKARTPTGTGAPKPNGLAAKIIAAGRKRRGEA